MSESSSSLATIRSAAAKIRADHGVGHATGQVAGQVTGQGGPDGQRWLPVADWLDTAGADLWAHGPLCCDGGCDDCDGELWMPHARRALGVARAYLGEGR